VLGATAVLIAGALWWTVGTGTTPQAPPNVRSVATAPQTAPVVASQPVPVATAPVATAPPPPAQPLLDEQQVRDTLETWRLDWSRRDVDAYLKHYSPAFVPANGQSRAEWEALRRKNITSRPAIRVEVNGLRIEALDPDQFRLQFLQNYISGTYLETAQPKTLRMARSGKDWLIVGEWQGKEPASAARKP
jgi:adhesin transport system outer membrane protein